LGQIAGSSLGSHAAKRSGQDQGTHGWAPLLRDGGVLLKCMGNGAFLGAWCCHAFCPLSDARAPGGWLDSQV
jgi:hypothetical protein